MTRLHRLGWWAFAGLLGVNLFSLSLRPADAQSMKEEVRTEQAGGRGKCVGIAASTGRDRQVAVFRAFEDGTVEERRAEGFRDGQVLFTWKPIVRPEAEPSRRP